MMEEELAADHPNIELVEVVYGDDDDQTSFDKTAALLQTYPELKGIVSPPRSVSPLRPATSRPRSTRARSR